jgi:hypothetical protein
MTTDEAIEDIWRRVATSVREDVDPSVLQWVSDRLCRADWWYGDGKTTDNKTVGWGNKHPSTKDFPERS